MLEPVGMIVNSRSHAVVRSGSLLEAAARGLPSVRFLWLENFDALEADIGEMARAGVRKIFIEGGDGTLLAVLSACLAPGSRFVEMPDFAVLPGGSTNLAAKIFGFRARTAAQLRRRIIALAEGTAAPLREYHKALRVDHAGLTRPAIGFLLSTGSLPRAMLYTQREFHGGGARGSLAIAGAIVRFILTPWRFLDPDGAPVFCASALIIESGQHRIDGDHALALMSPLPGFNLGLRPFWGEGEGAIAMTHAAWPLRGFRRALFKILLRQTGRGLAAHGFTSTRGDRFDLHHDGPVMLDGEILPAAPDGCLSVTTTPALSFLR